jgi:hypothetical protein
MPQLHSSRMRVAKCAALTTIAAAAATASAAGQAGSPGTPPLAPAITELEADWVGKGRLKLRAQAVPRGAKVEKVTFRYRGKLFRAKHVKPWDYVKTVRARGGDGKGDRVRFKTRACTATACATKTGGDVAN